MSFKKVASKIARKQGISKKRASAILASSTRKASAAAKRKNPKLKRVKGKAKRRKGYSLINLIYYGEKKSSSKKNFNF